MVWRALDEQMLQTVELLVRQPKSPQVLAHASELTTEVIQQIHHEARRAIPQLSALLPCPTFSFGPLARLSQVGPRAQAFRAQGIVIDDGSVWHTHGGQE
jgi:hypothetical protein